MLDVTLAGARATWHYPNAAGLRDWLGARPWLNEGGMCHVHAGAELIGDFIDALTRLAFAAHAEPRALSVQVLHCGQEIASPRAAIARAIGVADRATISQIVEVARVDLHHHPRVLVLLESAPVAGSQWDEVTALVEAVLKRGGDVPLAVVLCDSSRRVSVAPSFVFDIGYPSLSVMSEGGHLDAQLSWQRYLHLRAWWDSGGQLGIARSTAESLAQVAFGDDDEVERVLQLAARGIASNIEAINDARHFLGEPGGQRRAALEGRLRSQGLLWRPPAQTQWTLVPAAARALLGSGNAAGASMPRLRAALTCNPIASELLGSCLALECRIRERHWGREWDGQWEAYSEARDQHRQFLQGQREFVRYPADHPAAPDGSSPDTALFATLGEILANSKLPKLSVEHEVRLLRNSLAHGHYVTWAHCQRAIDSWRAIEAW